MMYHYGSGRPVLACAPCVRGIVRGFVRPNLPASVRDAVVWRGGVWETDATEVLDGRRVDLSAPGQIAVCALCGQVREVSDRATARVARTAFPWAAGGKVPVARCSDTCLEPPDIGAVTVEDALEEVRVAAEARALDGVAWSGLTWSMGPEARATWTAAKAGVSDGESVAGTPIAALDGVHVFKDNADFLAGYSAVWAATRALMAAQGQGVVLVRANPALLDDVLEAVRLAPEDPNGALALLGALA